MKKLMFNLNIQLFAGGSSEDDNDLGGTDESGNKKKEPEGEFDTKQLSEEVKKLKEEFESYKSAVEGVKDSVTKNSTDLAKVNTEVSGLREAYKETFIKPKSDTAHDNEKKSKDFNLLEAITDTKRR